MKLVDYRNHFTPIEKVKQLLSYAVGPATDEKLSGILGEVYSQADAKLYIFMDNDDLSLGMIGFKRAGDSAQVLHIAVDEEHRNCGIGRAIIDELLKLENLTELTAETDHASVGFYQRYGFAIQSLGEKYPGVERFHCQLSRG